MREQAAVQHHDLNEGMDPEAVIEARPDLEEAASRVLGLDLETRTHYGRPYAYHPQAATKNWLGAWIAADAPAPEVNAFEVLDWLATL